MERKLCVICSDKLEVLFTRKKYPISASPPSHAYESDQCADQIFTSCPTCSCVQLGTLIRQEDLYTSSHNNTANTPTWKEHHNKFAEFIQRENTILEIGGSGILYDILKGENPSLQYSCLDICEPAERIPDITYFTGNCETYSFSDCSPIVMSHVFEHLYNPRKFVENMHAANINSVYISIPNMEELIAMGSSCVLHNEHTFYIDKVFIEWLFSQYGYVLSDYYEFKRHSLFFHFQKGSNRKPMQLVSRPDLVERIHTLLKDSVRFQAITLKPNSFIIPAGLFGQLLLHSTGASILGFLDNDTAKQGKRVYGTPYYVYPFDELRKHDSVTVYILAGPYTEELVHQLHAYGRNIEVIVL